MTKDKVKKILFFYLFAMLLTANLFGQSNNIEFDHYTTNDGLSDGYINAFLRDSKGFMWIGTANGLNRFDGISFKSYYFDSNDSTSISGSGVNFLIEDSLQNIWVFTTNGLCVYDHKNDNFSRKKISVNGEILNDFLLNAGHIDRKGYFWVATSNNGIYRFNLSNNSTKIIDAKIFLLDEEDVATTYKNDVYSIVEDEKGKIWVASYSNKLFYFDEQNKKFISQTINHPEANKFSNNRKSMLKDRDGDFFITIEQVGILIWDRKNDHFRLYKQDGTEKMPRGNILFALCEDKNGLIWMGDRNSEGISIYNKKTNKFSYCQSVGLDPYSLITNKINCIYQDNTGSMWVGTIIGINKYSPGKSKFNRYFSNSSLPDKLSYNNTLCFAESRTGDIWIGTDGGGLNRLDRKTGKFIHYKHDLSNRNSLSSNSIISICEDHDGTLWLATFNGGLAKMKDNKFSAFYPDPNNSHSISNINIWNVFEDSKRNLWVGTLNSGLDLFDRKTNRFYHYTSKIGDSTSLCNNSIIGIYEDSKQQLYISTYGGVSIINLNDYDFSKMPPVLKFRNLLPNENKNSLISNRVYCVKEDNEGKIWFGSLASGIDKLDPLSGKFTNYSIKDGLPGNSVSSILVDSLNNLWLATDKGLAKFNPETKEVVVFDEKDGLQNKSLKSWAIKTKDGEMYFGGPNGFNSFYPDRISNNRNKNKPPVFITGLKIFNKPIKIKEELNNRVVLTSDISETSELVLTYKENYFTFEFIALDYTTPEKNNYAYQMEGFDSEWVQCGNKREANYTNLDAGEYTFRVKASNNDGVWNETGTFIKVIILPPWWKTWWFRIFEVLSIISLLTYVFVSRIRQFQKQKELLERLVAEKTSELQKMNSMLIKQAEELNLTNSLLEKRQEQIEEQSDELLAQKESLVIMNNELHELNATKDKFFSIIAHDIKNPFNAILGFTDLLEENFKEWTDEMKLEIITLVNKSSRNLYQLLENLLQWSRSQRGIIEYNPERIELAPLFQSVIDIMRGSAEAKNIELAIALPEEDLAVFADRQMLDTIMRNLISNALKFTNTGGNVRIVAENNDGLVNIKVTDARFVKIKVTDNGVGIRSDIKDKLFRIDSNQTTPGTKNETGTGLGLLLVKEFVTRHGGEIGVESTIGVGSTFYFTLPLAD